MGFLDVSNNINNYDRASVEGAGSSQWQVGATVADVSLVKKPKLTPEQKQEMMLLGLAPENDADVQKYLTMTPEEKTAQIKQFESANQPIITETPTVQTADETTVSPETPVEQNVSDVEQPVLPEPPVEQEVAETSDSFIGRIREEIQNLGIDTDSDEWKAKSHKEKMQTAILAGAKSKCTEEEWNNLTQEQKIAAGLEFLSREVRKFVPNWDELSSEDKLAMISEQMDLGAIAEVNHISLAQLAKMKKENPEQFTELKDKYYAENGKTDLLAIGQVTIAIQRKQSKSDMESNYESYLSSVGKERPKDPVQDAILKFEYLENKKKNNEELSHYEEKIYENIKSQREFKKYCDDNNLDIQNLQNRLDYLANKQNKSKAEQFDENGLLKLKELCGGDLSSLQDGEYSFTQLGIEFSLNEDGILDFSDPENFKVFDEYCKNNGGYEAVLKKLNGPSNIQIAKLLAYKNNGPKFKAYTANKTLSETTNLILFSVINAESSTEAQEWSATDGTRAVNKTLKQNGRPMDGFYEKVAENARTFQKEPAAKLNVTALEIGDEELVDASTKGTAEREDALDVFDLVNSWVNDSDNISDEMKELYAQKSVEYLSPENRDVQAERLRSYGSESFNKGVDTGYENIRTGNTSSNENSSVSQHSENINVNNGVNEYNKFANEINQGYVSIAQVREILNTLGFEERKEFIKTLTPEQLSKLPIRVCEEFPELIKDLVDAGKGLDIINQCDMSTGNKAISLMMNNPKQRKELAAVRPERFSQYTQWVLEESGVVPRSSKAHKPLPKGLIY